MKIALFPEMYSNGYNIYNRSVKEWMKEAIDIESDYYIYHSFRIHEKRTEQ